MRANAFRCVSRTLRTLRALPPGGHHRALAGEKVVAVLNQPDCRMRLLVNRLCHFQFFHLSLIFPRRVGRDKVATVRGSFP